MSEPTDTGVKHGPYLQGDGPQRPDGMPAQIPNPYLSPSQVARLSRTEWAHPWRWEYARPTRSGSVRTDPARP